MKFAAYVHMPEASVRRQYNRLAAIYDCWWRTYLRRTLSLLRDWARLPPDARILDLACGTGEWERLMLAAQPQQRIIGADLSSAMLHVATTKVATVSQVAFAAASATQLPFPDGSFDVVVSASAFHYFDQPAVALAEIHRVLVPHGEVIILDWCRDFTTIRLLDHVLSLIDPAHHRAYTLSEIEHLLIANGFSITHSAHRRISVVWGIMATAAVR